MKFIVEANSKLVLVRAVRRSQRTAWHEYGQLVWRDAEPMAPQCDATEVTVAAGTYSLVRVKNPFRAGGEPWLVIEGSMVGAPESHWRKLLAASRGVRLRKVEDGEVPQAQHVSSPHSSKAA